jgi:hypothetical protein
MRTSNYTSLSIYFDPNDIANTITVQVSTPTNPTTFPIPRLPSWISIGAIPSREEASQPVVRDGGNNHIPNLTSQMHTDETLNNFCFLGDSYLILRTTTKKLFIFPSDHAISDASKLESYTLFTNCITQPIEGLCKFLLEKGLYRYWIDGQ